MRVEGFELRVSGLNGKGLEVKVWIVLGLGSRVWALGLGISGLNGKDLGLEA